MNTSALTTRAKSAKALFEFMADWTAPAVADMTSVIARNYIVFGSDPVVSRMIYQVVSSQERECLRELEAYRRTIYANSVMMDAGYGRPERVFSNLYDALFAHLAVHGEGLAGSGNYRGQRDSNWKLEASYYRLKPDQRVPVERREDVVSSFWGVHVVPIDETRPDDLATQLVALRAKYPRLVYRDLTQLQQEAVVQHYLSGTKLLDFTKSIYVAAFFAANKVDGSQGDTRPECGAIFRIANREIEELAMGRVEAPELPERFRRIHRQNGMFLRIRFRQAINEPGLWLRWVFRHTDAAYPFCCQRYGITMDDLLPIDIDAP
jgi:FRG domain